MVKFGKWATSLLKYVLYPIFFTWMTILGENESNNNLHIYVLGTTFRIQHMTLRIIVLVYIFYLHIYLFMLYLTVLSIAQILSQSNPIHIRIFLRSTLILSFHLGLGLPNSIFSSNFWLKCLCNVPSPPYVLHAHSPIRFLNHYNPDLMK